jgi:hypothetical protein
VQLHPAVVGQAVLVVQVLLEAMVVLAVVEQDILAAVQIMEQVIRHLHLQAKAIMVVLGQVPLEEAFTAVVGVVVQALLV